MTAKREIEVPVVDNHGQTKAALRISLLPGPKTEALPQPLVDLRGVCEHDTALHPVQLLEGTEYLYEFVLRNHAGAISTDHPEIFAADTYSGERGRLRPGLYTGALSVTVFTGGSELGKAIFEVRSRKFGYMSHYRWMLRDIAESFAEIIMERFAPTEQRFEVDNTREATTLYQRFAFLKSLITGEAFDAAIQQIFVRPHRTWTTEEDLRPLGRSLPGTSAIARQIAGPGPRTSRMCAHLSHAIHSLPVGLNVQRQEETLDTLENRFIKFALIRWRDAVSDIGRALARHPFGGSVTRGLREVAAVTEHLDALLSADLFHEVGNLTQFPSGSQVLQKRADYREIFRAYVQFEAAAALSWQGGQDVYGAGQRDVATLYEYWVFLQLAAVISNMTQVPINQANLVDRSPDGLALGLCRRRERALSGTVVRLGRRLRVELWFNRVFSSGHTGPTTWTRPMRPDCSLRIAPDQGHGAEFEEVWLHFDAKYRVDKVTDLFDDPPLANGEDITKVADGGQGFPNIGLAKRDDLLKMHAYRDAIRRSAGAYVVFPGSEQVRHKMYQEILPGLGAFAVLPSETGKAEGIALLQHFISDVLDHVASQATQHERSRFWQREAYQERFRVATPISATPFLTRPPADTLVLLGYVKGKDHLEWIHRNLRYNLRADGRTGTIGLRSRELATDLVLLYGPGLPQPEIWRAVEEPEIYTRVRMLASGYPSPRGDFYYCLRLEPIPMADWPVSLTSARVEEVRHKEKPEVTVGVPIVTTWLELVK